MDNSNLPSPIGTAVEIRPKSRAPIAPEETSLRWPELLCLAGILVLADLGIYRGDGYAGWAAVFAASPVLLWIGGGRRRWDPLLPLLGLMLVMLACKLIWCGLPTTIVVGMALFPFFGLSLSGRRPYVMDAISFAAGLAPSGGRGLAGYGLRLLRYGRPFAVSNVIVFVVPAIVGALFCALFVLANPDLVESVSQTLARLLERLQSWLGEFSVFEGLFLLGVAWIAIGMLHAKVGPGEDTDPSAVELASSNVADEPAPRPLYLAWRNTLALVILIYAIYLAFEFHTLWFRVFPKGFYYSGYAHEGAAWLTIGLALATSILSLIFRGRILADARVGRLKRLAWLWSLENLLLALAVYHRLSIYVGFNGLTRLRIVGFYGVSAVVAGFAVVLVKIARGRDFAWLTQRQLWVLGIAAYLYAITPTDFLAMTYNVRCIQAGNLAPSVQITVQPLSVEGLIPLIPLLNQPDKMISDGVLALLEKRRDELLSEATTSRNWTSWQIADGQFLKRCESALSPQNSFENAVDRTEAWNRFCEYAYQWY
jgi:hypothetical protein